MTGEELYYKWAEKEADILNTSVDDWDELGEEQMVWNALADDITNETEASGGE